MGRRPLLLSTLLLLAINIAIAGKLFGVEYLAYNGSVEGTFIAIARIMAKYPGQWKWWPFWNCGMPFETAYLPLLQWMTAAVVLLTRASAARAFHIVAAGVYICGAPAVFWMALEVSRKWAASLFAALAYSCVSISALLVPAIGADAGGVWNLRRLQVMVYYGESPHTLALVLAPIAVVCFVRALAGGTLRWKILAGLLAAMVAVSNAFGILALGSALICWMLAFRLRPWWRAPLTIAAIGAVSYCWVSPWLSPAMIRAIRASAPTAGGDFRYRPETWLTLALTAAGFLLLAWLLKRAGTAPPLQFFLLFAYVQSGIVLPWYAWHVALVPQPHRYQLELDLALLLAVVFAAATLLERLPLRTRRAVSCVAAAALAVLTIHSVAYGRQLIQGADPARMPQYQIAKWLDEHRPGERAFPGGASSMLFNAVTDNPQLKGGHDQHMVNPFIAIVAFTIYSGANAGERDAGYSLFWLKAFGARTISVPDETSDDYYKPFVHPAKFEGVLPVLWRFAGNTIYEVPGRSPSLAHVIPETAVVSRTPIHGLDIAPAQAYVAALDDVRYPAAVFRWKSLSEVSIETTTAPGQVVAVQVTYDPGWEAWANGNRLRIRRDGLGLMAIEPAGGGPVEIDLRYTGGLESILTRGMSLAAMLIAAVLAIRQKVSAPIRPRGPTAQIPPIAL